MENATNFRNKYVLATHSLRYEDLEQVIGMGGPFVGILYYDDTKLNGNFSGPPILSDNQRFILLPKKNEKQEKKFIFRISKLFFTVFVIDLKENKLYESRKQFDLLFLESMVSDEIILYEANHNQINERRREIKFNAEEFIVIN